MTYNNEAPSALPVFYRTYSRRTENGKRESYEQVMRRALTGLQKVGHLTDSDLGTVADAMANQTMFPSGRWLWTGGTPWAEKPENTSSGYNCTSTRVTDFHSLALMMGCGTGAGR